MEIQAPKIATKYGQHGDRRANKIGNRLNIFLSKAYSAMNFQTPFRKLNQNQNINRQARQDKQKLQINLLINHSKNINYQFYTTLVQQTIHSPSKLTSRIDIMNTCDTTTNFKTHISISQQLFNEICEILSQIAAIRIMEKIVQDDQETLKEIRNFQKILEKLHRKMIRFKNDCISENDKITSKYKNQQAKKERREKKDRTDFINKVKDSYSHVFQEGCLRYVDIICKAKRIQHKIWTIDIQEWGKQCRGFIRQNKKQQTCCGLC